jgi:hypothetical protein
MSPESRHKVDVEHVEAILRRFAREFPDAVLLGGWATYLRTGFAKSHDIDVIVDHATLERLRSQFQLQSSRHVGGQKFEAKLEGVAIDIYPVYQSKLGQRLQFPVEVLLKHSETLDRLRLLGAEAQFVAKMAALLDRPDTLPGEKDRQEMWALLSHERGLDFRLVSRLFDQAGRKPDQQLELMGETFDLLEETPKLTKSNRTELRRQRESALGAVRDLHDRDRGLER